jgi:hypothetical protein
MKEEGGRGKKEGKGKIKERKSNGRREGREGGEGR